MLELLDFAKTWAPVFVPILLSVGLVLLIQERQAKLYGATATKNDLDKINQRLKRVEIGVTRIEARCEAYHSGRVTKTGDFPRIGSESNE